MPRKKELYEIFIGRMDEDIEEGHLLEASWYAYAVLEDRLVALLRETGGQGRNGNGKPIQMMGPKMKELKQRAKKDKLLDANFEFKLLDTWKHDRNNLMHAMADATMTIDQIDAASEKLAREGAALVRVYAAACRRVKKHRAKVGST